jgi:hypothetical protein
MRNINLLNTIASTTNVAESVSQFLQIMLRFISQTGILFNNNQNGTEA